MGGNERTSHLSRPRTWPTRSSSSANGIFHGRSLDHASGKSDGAPVADLSERACGGDGEASKECWRSRWRPFACRDDLHDGECKLEILIAEPSARVPEFGF